MQHRISRTKWLLAVAALLSSPIVLVLLVPLVVGLGLHITDVHSERGLVMLLWGPAGLVLLRRLARQMPPPRQPLAV